MVSDLSVIFFSILWCIYPSLKELFATKKEQFYISTFKTQIGLYFEFFIFIYLKKKLFWAHGDPSFHKFVQSTMVTRKPEYRKCGRYFYSSFLNHQLFVVKK